MLNPVNPNTFQKLTASLHFWHAFVENINKRLMKAVRHNASENSLNLFELTSFIEILDNCFQSTYG